MRLLAAALLLLVLGCGRLGPPVRAPRAPAAPAPAQAPQPAADDADCEEEEEPR